MRVFLTGATGFIGGRIVPELLAAGHSVVGATRSDGGAAALVAAGAEPFRGVLEDAAGLAAEAATCDAVIHTAFDHDFSNFVANCEKDRGVILALGEALKGSVRPLLITSGVGMGGGTPGVPATEAVLDRAHPNPRIASEEAAETLKADGVDVRVVRLPQVHDAHRQGLISPLIDIARAKGVSGWVGDGANRWPAAPVADVARLYVLALGRGERNARYNAVAEEGVAMRAIAETVAEGLGVPAREISAGEVAAHFGWMAGFMGMDMTASSAWTRQALDWTPTGPTLLEDLRRMDYAA